MSRFQHDVMLRVVKLLDIFLITVPFAVCWFFYYAEHIHMTFTGMGHLCMLALYAILYIILGKVYDAFLMSMQRVSELVYSQIRSARLYGGRRVDLYCDLFAFHKTMQPDTWYRSYCRSVRYGCTVGNHSTSLVL